MKQTRPESRASQSGTHQGTKVRVRMLPKRTCTSGACQVKIFNGCRSGSFWGTADIQMREGTFSAGDNYGFLPITPARSKKRKCEHFELHRISRVERKRDTAETDGGRTRN